MHRSDHGLLLAFSSRAKVAVADNGNWMLSQRTWEAALGALQVEVPKADFSAWFRDARFVRAGGREIVVAVPTVFAKEIVTRRYRELVARAVSKAHGGDVDVTFVVQADRPAGPPAWLADPEPAPAPRAGRSPFDRRASEPTLHL